MASVSQAQLSADLDHAISDFSCTLTVVLPSASTGDTFSSCKGVIGELFDVSDVGREPQKTMAYYININGLSTVPSKGWVINDGSRDMKVKEATTDQSGLLLKLDCIDRYQSD